MKLKFAVLVAAIFATSGQGATKRIQGSFEAKFYGANVFPWIKGIYSGRVPPTVNGRMQTAIDGLLVLSRQQVDFALYGVSQQTWLYSRLEEMVARSVRVRAVVERGVGRDARLLGRHADGPAGVAAEICKDEQTIEGGRTDDPGGVRVP